MKRLSLAIAICCILMPVCLFGGATVVTDTMTGTNGTDLNAHTGELGATWTRATGFAKAMVLANGRVRMSGTNGDAIYYASGVGGTAEYDLDFDINVQSVPAATDYHYVHFYMRIDTAGINGYRMYYDPYSSSGTWEMQYYTAGSWTPTGVDAVSVMSAGNTYHAKFSMRNALKAFYLNGVLIDSSTNNTNTSIGKVALAGFATTTVGDAVGFHYDNVVVTNPGGGGFTLLGCCAIQFFAAPWLVH